MEDCMTKLALWKTRTFNPIITHHELEPIMATLGFISIPWFPPNKATGGGSGTDAATTTAWKEYLYCDGGCWSKSLAPRPRLPYPRIDGLHIYTYQAFLDAVNFYLRMNDISDLFHIRGMPLHRVRDRGNKWRRMEEDGSNMLVYREGTLSLDQATCNFYRINTNTHNINYYDYGINGNSSPNSITIRSKGRNSTVGYVVPLKDVIVGS